MKYYSTKNKTFGLNSKEFIILHHTATGEGSIKGLINAFTGDRQVSAHYIVDTDGEVYKFGEDDDILWHCGVSQWRGKTNLNKYSIGIEVVGPLKDGGFTKEQKLATLELIVKLAKKYNIPKENLLRHKDISPGRKVDIADTFFEEGFEEYRNRIYKLIDLYDQTNKKETRQSCSIYTFLNIMKYDFGVKIENDFIYKLVSYLEKIGVLLPEGAKISILYPLLIKLISIRLGLKLKLKVHNTKNLNTQKALSIAFLKNSFLDKQKDYRISRQDIIDLSKTSKGGHNVMIKKTKDNYLFVDSWGGLVYRISPEDLELGVEKGVYSSKAVSILPSDSKTKLIKNKALQKVRKDDKFLTIEDLKKIISYI